VIVSRSDVRVVVVHERVDAFGNPIPPALDDDTLEELAGPPHDERAARRLLRGELKLARGGVLDIDPRLLREAPLH
jgi:hypothetical protein